MRVHHFMCFVLSSYVRRRVYINGQCINIIHLLSVASTILYTNHSIELSLFIINHFNRINQCVGSSITSSDSYLSTIWTQHIDTRLLPQNPLNVQIIIFKKCRGLQKMDSFSLPCIPVLHFISICHPCVPFPRNCVLPIHSASEAAQCMVPLRILGVDPHHNGSICSPVSEVKAIKIQVATTHRPVYGKKTLNSLVCVKEPPRSLDL